MRRRRLALRSAAAAADYAKDHRHDDDGGDHPSLLIILGPCLIYQIDWIISISTILVFSIGYRVRKPAVLHCNDVMPQTLSKCNVNRNLIKKII